MTSLRSMMQSFARMSLRTPSLSSASSRCLSTSSTRPLMIKMQQISRSSTIVTGRATTVSRQPFSSTCLRQSTLNQVMRGCRKKKISLSKAPALKSCPQRKGVCSRVYVTKPQETKFCTKESSKNQAHNRSEYHCLHPWRRPQPARTFRRSRQRWSSTGFARCQVGQLEILLHRFSLLLCGWLTCYCLVYRRYKVVRGALDLGGVAGRTTSRSKYGGKHNDRNCI